MMLCMIFVVFACVYTSQGWNVDLSGRFPAQPLHQPRPGVFNNPRCFGLARRTRQQKITMPLIYNTRTGQSQIFPKFLYTAEQSVISRAENDGWEVRMKSLYVPQYIYDRVPICCPWEQNCNPVRQVITSPAAENSGTCANGGQMIYRDGQQKCECAPGYQGIWCQLRVLPGENQPYASFPSGPLIRMLSAPGPYGDMVREAEMWRSKAKQNTAAPMLPVKGRFPAPASPWAYGAAAMMQHQLMQAKRIQMEEMYRQAHGNFNNQIPQQPLAFPDVGRSIQMPGVNNYGFVDSSTDNKFLSMPETNKNPYSTISSQGQFPPDMLRAFYVVHESLKHQQPLNPYSHMSLDLPRQLQLPAVQKVSGEQAGVNPYNNRPPQGRDMPQARTPWDLDPFGQQQNPSFMNYPGMPVAPNRNKQAVAIVLYQQLMNQQKNKLSGRNDTPINSAGIETATADPVGNINTQQQQTLGTLPQERTAQTQQVTNIPETTPDNITEQVPRNEQPVEVSPGPSPQYQPQPSSEEMKRIEQCQAVLTPRLSECLASYGLVMEQFMNPEYMQKARAVCMASQSVGQCIMQHDMDCGEGDVVMTTRKMINSVLHMMGMICQQITARGETPVTTGQGQQNLMQTPGGGMLLPVPEPLTPNDAVTSVEKVQEPPMINVNPQQQGTGETPIMTGQGQQNFMQTPGLGMPLPVTEPQTPNNAVTSVEKVQEPPMINENPQQQGVVLPSEQSEKSTDTQNYVQDHNDVTKASVGKGHVEPDSTHLIRNSEAYNGHDSAQPVSQDLTVLGYPLWLVITVGLASFIFLVIFVLGICLCCRRRSQKKSAKGNKDIEKMPAPLERVCSIGIPPPSYNTTVLQQNQDGLELPPLDVNMSVNDGEDDIKVPLDDDTDDESADAAGKKAEETRK